MRNKILEAGKIVNTHGLRGEVKIVTWTDSQDVFYNLSHLYIEENGKQRTLNIQGIKQQKDNIIVKFNEFNKIEEVEHLKNTIVLVDRTAIGEPPANRYYVCDLLGSDVFLEDGSLFGKLVDINQNGSSNVYEIKTTKKTTLLLPAITDVTIKNVNIDESKIVIHILDGLEEF